MAIVLYYATAPLRHWATAPQRHSATASQRHSATGPQRHSATAPQRHSATAPQRHSDTASTRHSATAPQRHSATAPQRHSATALQLRWRVEEDKDTRSARAETITAGHLNRHTNTTTTCTNYGDLSYRQRNPLRQPLRAKWQLPKRPALSTTHSTTGWCIIEAAQCRLCRVPGAARGWASVHLLHDPRRTPGSDAQMQLKRHVAPLAA